MVHLFQNKKYLKSVKIWTKLYTNFKTVLLMENISFLTVDATYFKVRENGRIISKAFFIAYGTNIHGHREIIGFDLYPNESANTWTDFFMKLKKRGLNNMLMITSDAHEGILNAIGKVFPTIPWQRCQFHFVRNIVDKTPKRYQAGLQTELQDMFNSKNITEARKLRNQIIEDYRDVAEAAMSCLDDGFESSMTVMLLPVCLRRYYRTSNHIKRLNKELKRRSKVIGVFPNESSVLRLMGSVLMELHDAMLAGRAIFSKDSLATLMSSNVPAKLIVVAEEQQKLRAA